MRRYVPIALFVFCALLLVFVLQEPSHEPRFTKQEAVPESELDAAIAAKIFLAPESPSEEQVIDRDALSLPSATQTSTTSLAPGVRVRAVLDNGTPVSSATVFWVNLKQVEQNPSAAPYLTSEPDVLALAKTFGNSTTTDDKGYAFLPALPEYTDVLGSSSGLYASHWYQGETDITLVLQPSQSFRVQAFSSSGLPVPNIDIGLFRSYSRQDELLWPEITARTDQNGLATLQRFELYFSVRDKKATVAAMGLFPQPIRASINIQELPITPVPLEVPPFGSVAVQLTGAKQYPAKERRRCTVVLDPNPTPGRTPEQLRESYKQSESLELWALLWENDTAVFECLGLNQSFLAEIQGVDPLQSTLVAFEGPTQPGQRLNIEIHPLIAQRSIRMQVLTAENLPLRSKVVSVELHQIGNGKMRSRSLDRRFRLATDKNGELDFQQHGDFFLNFKHLESVSVRIAFMEGDLANWLVGKLKVYPQQLDSSDTLPPIQLHAQDILVAGQVIGWPQERLQGLELRIEHHPDRTTATPPTWRGWQEFDSAFTDDSGNFFAPLPVIPPTGHLRLRPPSFDTPLQIVNFQVGETDLLVDLSGKLTLSGTIIPPEGLDISNLNPVFVPTPGTATQWRTQPGRIEPDLTFQLNSLGPQTGVFQILGRPGNLPLITIENVVPHKPGESSDPRLNPVDLRNSLYYFEIQPVDANNEVVPGAYLIGVKKDRRLWSSNPSEGIWRIPSGNSTIEAQVWAKGFSLQPVLLLPGLNTVTLTKGIPVQIRLQQLEELEGLSVHIELFPTSDAKRYFHSGEQRVPASGVVNFNLAAADTYKWSFKVMRGTEFITGYMMSDVQDQIVVTDSNELQEFSVTLPMQQIAANPK